MTDNELHARHIAGFDHSSRFIDVDSERLGNDDVFAVRGTSYCVRRVPDRRRRDPHHLDSGVGAQRLDRSMSTRRRKALCETPERNAIRVRAGHEFGIARGGDGGQKRCRADPETGNADA